jgi:predicted ATPase
MIFEDVHWADPTSLEALGRVVDRIRTLGALLIVTYRPEFSPPWIGRPHVAALTVNRLGEREIIAMIDRVTAISRYQRVSVKTLLSAQTAYLCSLRR